MDLLDVPGGFIPEAGEDAYQCQCGKCFWIIRDEYIQCLCGKKYYDNAVEADEFNNNRDDYLFGDESC